MALMQGDVLPSVTTTQTQATTAPQFYQDYLSNIAQQGAAGTAGAQFVGASPLQQQAFQMAGQNVGAYSPYLQQAANLVGGAAGMSAAGAAQPFLETSALGSAAAQASPFIQQAVGTSPLAAAAPYLQRAAGLSGAAAAAPGLQAAGQAATADIGQYMNPYTQSVVNEIGRLGQQQIRETLAPQAVAGAVGTGQFGSQRGAQVLGQTLRDALANISGQQTGALSQGYTQALTASQADLARRLQAAQAAGTLTQADASKLAQLGATAGQLGSAQQQALLGAGSATGQLSAADLSRMLTAGQSTGQLTGTDITSRLAAGQQMGALGQAAQQLGLSDVNALATLGAQQQQIGQAQQLFPLQTAQLYANLLKGAQVPTSVSSTYTGPLPGAYAASPLQQIAGLGSLVGGLFQSGAGGTTPIQNMISTGSNIGNWLGSIFGGSGSTGGATNVIGGDNTPTLGPIDTTTSAPGY